MMKVKIKRLCKEAKLPTRAHATDAGFDLVAISKSFDSDDNVVYGTGLAFEIPQNHVGLLFPRSSNAKKDLLLSNSVGVVDSGYRGEVLFKFKKTYKQHLSEWGTFVTQTFAHDNEYKIGDRIGQLIIVPYPQIEFEEVEQLSDSDRGEGGYGSSGN